MEDYSDDPGNRGVRIYDDPAEIEELVQTAHDDGMSVAIHCIGDAAAEQAVSLADRNVCVLQSRSIPQGITALMNFDPGADFVTNRSNMTDALDRVQSGQITFAVRDSEYNGVQIHKGDIIGMHNGKIEYCGNSVHDVVLDMMKAVVTDDAELITVYYGADTTKEDAEQVAAEIADQYPNCDVDCLLGGQPLYYYLISVE